MPIELLYIAVPLLGLVALRAVVLRLAAVRTRRQAAIARLRITTLDGDEVGDERLVVVRGVLVVEAAGHRSQGGDATKQQPDKPRVKAALSKWTTSDPLLLHRDLEDPTARQQR